MALSNAEARQVAIDRLTAEGGVTDASWQRARGWAVLMGLMLLDTGLIDHPVHARIGAATLANLLSDSDR